jgi:hypothetical protein
MIEEPLFIRTGTRCLTVTTPLLLMWAALKPGRGKKRIAVVVGRDGHLLRSGLSQMGNPNGRNWVVMSIFVEENPVPGSLSE